MAVATISDETLAREAALKDLMRGYGALAIAYSGGVDSTYLAAVAHEVLGDKASMILADSPSIPRSELKDAAAIAGERGWNFHCIQTHEFQDATFLKNDASRCYVCKGELFNHMDTYAKEHGISVIAYGELAEDGLDPTRMGAKAAREHRVVAPLAEAKLTKDEIRALSKQRGLPTWDKASFACLSSRVPTGTPIDIPTLSKVEKAEEVLRGLGFRQYRARHHGDICRIEVDPEDMEKLLDPMLRSAVAKGVRAAGYRYVTLDLSGYRMGNTAGL